MKFCREIDENTRIFYDPVSNQFLINGSNPIDLPLTKEYDIIELVEAAEMAGLRQSEILYNVSLLI